MKVKNVGPAKIHVMVTTGGHIVEPNGIFECTENEFEILKGFFKLEAVVEEIIETAPEEIKEVTKKSGKKAK